MTNAAVLAVDQNSSGNRQVYGGPFQVWTANVPGTADRYLALFNRSGASANVSVPLGDLGIGSAVVMDLWLGSNLGTLSGTFSRSLPTHGAGLYRLSPLSTVVPPAAYTLTAQHSGKRADVFNASVGDGANVVQWTANGQPNQQWRFRDIGSGYFQVVSVNSAQCLDVFGGQSATGDGVRVVQWACGTGTNQHWRVQDVGNGYAQLVARHSGKCLDVTGASTADGTQLIQWTCGSGPNQRWLRSVVPSV
jgi:hypothetical protein